MAAEGFSKFGQGGLYLDNSHRCQWKKRAARSFRCQLFDARQFSFLVFVGFRTFKFPYCNKEVLTGWRRKLDFKLTVNALIVH